VEIGQPVTGPFQARSPHAGQLAQELGPAAGALYTLLSGKTTLGYELPADTSRASGAAQGLIGDVPVLRVLGINGRNKGAESASPSRQPIFPDTGHNRWGRYLAGGLFPATTTSKRWPPVGRVSTARPCPPKRGRARTPATTARRSSSRSERRATSSTRPT
jgi:hypothetical protein